MDLRLTPQNVPGSTNHPGNMPAARHAGVHGAASFRRAQAFAQGGGGSRVRSAIARSSLFVVALALGPVALDGCARERGAPASGTASPTTAATPDAGSDTAPLATDAQLSVARATHQSVALQDGRLLVLGGCGGESCATVHASAEVYDPGRRAFSATGDMAEGRSSLSAVRLDDGRVLAVGGWNGSSASALAELYLPERGGFVAAGTLSEPRMHPQTTLLADGRVLVSGGEVSTGQATRALDLFDPRTATFSAGRLHEPRAFHTATRLKDGRVLIVGGHSGRNAILRSAEIFDPATGRSEPTGALSVPRYKHAAVALADGRVLVIAGSGPGSREAGRHATTEIFDPNTGAFSAGPTLRAARYKVPDAAVVTAQGHVIVAGGAERGEIWRRGDQGFELLGGAFDRTYEFPTVNLLADGDALIVGGYDDDIRATRRSWRLSLRAGDGVAADPNTPPRP